jgi:hypothetical protein
VWEFMAEDMTSLIQERNNIERDGDVNMKSSEDFNAVAPVKNEVGEWRWKALEADLIH